MWHLSGISESRRRGHDFLCQHHGMPLVDPVTMSTTVTKGSSTQTTNAKAAIGPVPPYNDIAALVFTIIHPLALGALFVWQFGALVADPVTTLYNGLPVVAGVQAVHAIAAFPAAGSQLGRASAKARPGEKKKHATGPNPIVIAVLALTLAIIVTPALYALLILFGAPFLTHAPETFLCCAHLAVLALFPIFYSRGANTAALQATLGLSAPIDQTFGGFVGAFVGAWLGAVPIPLDWDREWQKWPVTIVVGIYLGYLIGAKVFGTLFFGKQWATSAPTVKEE